MTAKPIILSMLLAACSVSTKAQDPAEKTPEARSQQRTERMARELGLTADQVVQVSAINDRYVVLWDEQKSRQHADRKATREEQEALRAAYDAELKAVLTPEQYTTFQAGREKARKERPDKPRLRMRISGR